MGLEFLDEYEEYWLMMGHYFMSMLKYTKSSEEDQDKASREIIESLKFKTN